MGAGGTLGALASVVMFGAYEVRATIARGGTSRVMLAVHAVTGARVAVKALVPELASHPEMRARLHAERSLVARVAHEGIVEIHEVGVADDGTPFLVMEYLDGQPLGAVVGESVMDVPMALAIAAQVASALAALHAAGVVHCDVKHDNIVVLDGERNFDGLPRVKLVDFGVSRRVPQRLARGSLPGISPAELEAEDATCDATSEIAGTPWCMAPEQWQSRPEPASDVYSLGCLLFDLLAGRPPFFGTIPELMTAHLESPPPDPASLVAMPDALDRLMLAMLTKEARQRPTMAAVAAALEELLADALGDAADHPSQRPSQTGAMVELRAAS